MSRIKFKEQKCVIQVLDKLKHTTRPGHTQNVQELESFEEDEKLCVVTCLKDYIPKSEPIRDGGDKLLLSWVRSHGPAAKDTISRWMKSVPVEAASKDFAPHSVRDAASSAMTQSGMSPEDVSKTAGWSNATTFRKSYYQPAPQDNPVSKSEAQTKITKYFGKKDWSCVINMNAQNLGPGAITYWPLRYWNVQMLMFKYIETVSFLCLPWNVAIFRIKTLWNSNDQYFFLNGARIVLNTHIVLADCH